MHITELTWKEFKDDISRQDLFSREIVFRGQANSEWELITSIGRAFNSGDRNFSEEFFRIYEHISCESEFDFYTRFILEKVKPFIEPYCDNEDDFLAFLQHNSYPTPLLDWTYSPYVAVFFAVYQKLDPNFLKDNPGNTFSIYKYLIGAWEIKGREDFDHCPDPDVYGYEYEHGSVGDIRIRRRRKFLDFYTPSFKKNSNGSMQQSVLSKCSSWNQETYINKHGSDYIEKYIISYDDVMNVMTDLQKMNINFKTLFPGLSGEIEALKLNHFVFRKPMEYFFDHATSIYGNW